MSSSSNLIKAQKVAWQPDGSVLLGRETAAGAETVGGLVLSGDLEQLRQSVLAQARQQAQQLLAAAQQQANDLVRAAQEQANEVTAHARAEGLAAAEAEAGHLLLAAHAAVDEVNAWQTAQFRQNEAAVIGLVLQMGQKVFGGEVALPADVLRRAFERAVAEARPLGNLRLRLNPEDAAVLGPHWPEHSGLNGQLLELLPDASIRRGGCLVEGEYGTVDAQLETQWQVIHEALAAAASAARQSASAAGDQP